MASLDGSPSDQGHPPIPPSMAWADFADTKSSGWYYPMPFPQDFGVKKNLKKSNALRSSLRSSCGASALVSSTFSWTLRRRRSPNCSNGSVYRVSLNPLIIVSCVIFQMNCVHSHFPTRPNTQFKPKKKGFGWWPHSPSDVISLGNLDVS